MSLRPPLKFSGLQLSEGQNPVTFGQASLQLICEAVSVIDSLQLICEAPL